MIRNIATLLLILAAVVGGPCVIILSLDYQPWAFLPGLALVALPLLLARAINRSPPAGPDDVIEAGTSVPLVPRAPGESPPDRD